jgi:hypothetical protein
MNMVCVILAKKPKMGVGMEWLFGAALVTLVCWSYSAYCWKYRSCHYTCHHACHYCSWSHCYLSTFEALTSRNNGKHERPQEMAVAKC